MRRTDFGPEELKRHLYDRGMTVTQFAREVGISQPALSAILHGGAYVGERRRKRIEAALLRLRIDPEHAHLPEQTPDKPAKPNIRTL